MREPPVWSPTLDSLVEISCSAAAHYDVKADAVAAIDRFWISWPGRALTQMKVSPRVEGDPEQLAQKVISDRAAHVVLFRQRRPPDATDRPIPKHI
eukprot:5124166-Pyramimonas_sp.AAC.1